MELIKAIKTHALNYQEKRHDIKIILDAPRTVSKMTQKQHPNSEGSMDCTKRCKVAAVDVLVSCIGGPITLLKKIEERTEALIKKVKKETFELTEEKELTNEQKKEIEGEAEEMTWDEHHEP